MARLFGILGTRADFAGRLLKIEADALRVKRPAPPSRRRAHPFAWGVGFYQGGEVLLRRRPTEDSETIDFGELVSDLRADVAIGHVRDATVGSLRTENTHPFRYRQWLFAQTGTLQGFDEMRGRLLESLPEFLRASVRGETDAEVVFHVVLSFLHDAGALRATEADCKSVEEAIRHTVQLLDTMAAELGTGPVKINLLMTNGECLVGLHAGEPMASRTFEGKTDEDLLLGDDGNLRRKVANPAHLRFWMIASDFDEVPNDSWRPLPERSIVTLTRKDGVRTRAL